MESYCNMNSSNGRQYRNTMNQGYRTNDRMMQERSGETMSGYDRSMKSDCEQQAMHKSEQQRNQNYAREMMQKREKQMMSGNRNRVAEVECSCKIKEKKNCHKHDEMESLGYNFPLVMAYVPWQQWGELYDAECGLMQGTIFKDLNFIFCGVRC